MRSLRSRLRSDEGGSAIVEFVFIALVVVRCSGSVPTLLASLGNLLPLEVAGRAVKEAAA